MSSKTYGDRWKIIEGFGEGGQAHTFRVQDLHDGSTHWILKRLKNRKRLGRFKREVLALQAIDSPHIPRTEDYSIDDPAFHVSANLGIGLDQYPFPEPLDIDQTLSLFEQVVTAVQEAHSAGVVHRDIKPNNVVVNHDGTKAYLIDFGICQYSEGELTLLTGKEAFGNPAFAAPEAFLGREEEPGPPCDVYSLGKLLYYMVSRGRYINREQLSPVVLERIQTNHNPIRFYLAQLLRGTVIEEPWRRWTAPRLLAEVHTTRRLVDRVKQYEHRNQILLLDGFGLEDDFNRSSSRSATTSDPQYAPGINVVQLGDPPGDGDVGTAFEVPANRSAYLETITLGISYRAGEDELDVWLTPDLDGKPDDQNVLEALRVSGARSTEPRIASVYSQEHPVLQSGQRYWVVLSVSDPHSEIALYGAPYNFVPRPAFIAERFDHGDWAVAETSPGYAIRVVARLAEPE